MFMFPTELSVSWGQGALLSCALICSRGLTQCLLHGRCVINNEWMQAHWRLRDRETEGIRRDQPISTFWREEWTYREGFQNVNWERSPPTLSNLNSPQCTYFNGGHQRPWWSGFGLLLWSCSLPPPLPALCFSSYYDLLTLLYHPKLPPASGPLYLPWPL